MEKKIQKYSKNDIVINGRYRHFKGNTYIVKSIATDCETLEEVVIYEALYGENKVWVRNLQNFLEEIPKRPDNITGQKHRFELIDNNREV